MNQPSLRALQVLGTIGLEAYRCRNRITDPELDERLDAYYSPKQHTNSVWFIVASGRYPLNTYGDSIDIFIHDRGKCFHIPRACLHIRGRS